jgi:hypothetical protein
MMFNSHRLRLKTSTWFEEFLKSLLNMLFRLTYSPLTSIIIAIKSCFY